MTLGGSPQGRPQMPNMLRFLAIFFVHSHSPPLHTLPFPSHSLPLPLPSHFTLPLPSSRRWTRNLARLYRRQNAPSIIKSSRQRHTMNDGNVAFEKGLGCCTYALPQQCGYALADALVLLMSCLYPNPDNLLLKWHRPSAPLKPRP